MKVGGKKRKLTPWIQAAKAYWPKAKKSGMSYSKMLSSDEFREFYKENYEKKKGGNDLNGVNDDELLEFVDGVLDELGSRHEVEKVQDIFKTGTGADRQLEVFKNTGSLIEVVKTIESSFLI